MNPELSIRYELLSQCGIEFDREKLGRGLFEGACRILEGEGIPVNGPNLEETINQMLIATTFNFDMLNLDRTKKYSARLLDNYLQIEICEKV